MRAVAVRNGRLTAIERAAPLAWPGAVRIAVKAFSLNRGDVRGALDGGDGDAPLGWDFAGVVIEAPVDSGFSPGDRVAGLTAAGAWAQEVVAAPIQLAPLPEGVDFAAGAALPVAGLSAALALGKRGELAGLDVLVTGATGGVGMLAVQLARTAGARVTALVRDEARGATLRGRGATTVTLAGLVAAGPFDLIVETVGGDALVAALDRMRSRAVCVLVGDAAGGPITFDPFVWRTGAGGDGGKQIYGFFLGEEVMRTGVGAPLAALLAAVADGTLDPGIAVELPWTDVDAVAADLLARRFAGKAVLRID